MKKIASIAIVAAAVLSGCNGDKLREAEAQNQQLKGDLSETLATQDSLLVLVNDISDGMAQIKDLEKIISTPGGIGGRVGFTQGADTQRYDRYPAGSSGASSASCRP